MAEVVVVHELAARRGEDQPAIVRLASEELMAQDVSGGAREVDAPARRAGLHRHELALIGAVLDLDGHRIEVEVPVAQREQLALPEAGERGELDEVAVRSDGVGGQLLDLVPAEEAHLGLVTPRRLHAEDALVDEVPPLLRVGEHLLEHAQRELGLARRATCKPGHVVLDRGRADLVERHRCEHIEVRQDLADARERRRADAQRVALEPTGDELAEGLGRRLIERAERRAALLLEDEAVGVLLEHERSRARTAGDVDPASAVALSPVV